jgi:nitroreductase
MTRRELLRAAAGAWAFAGVGVAPGCARARPAARARPTEPIGPPLNSKEERILAFAALAPSGHNTQPWAVRILDEHRWILGADGARLLPAVDPGNRELVLSLGAFIENLTQAASASGLTTEVEVTPARGATEVCALRLVAGTRADERSLERIRLRRMVREGYSSQRLREDDLSEITEPYGEAAAWFPAGSREARWLSQAEVEAFRGQAGRDAAQVELSRWIRFSDEELARHEDGLTPETMEVGPLASFYMRHFMARGSVMTRSFRDAGIDRAAKQASEGAGWLVVTAPDESVSNLLDTGRRFERMALLLRERKLAAHPMSQVLEEEPFRSQVAKELTLAGAPQFTLRVGYVAEYPPPVSPRRPPRAFTRVG